MSESVSKLTFQEDKKSNSLFVLLHGQQSSKEEWLDASGFTKGGLVTDHFKKNNIPFVAYDLYGHGEMKSKANYDKPFLEEKEWEEFIHRSVEGIGQDLQAIKGEGLFQHIHLLSYSVGSIVGLQVQEKYDLFDDVYMCVPIPQREYDDQFSLHNNITKVQGKVVIFSGKEDNEVSIDEVEWFFQQLPSKNNKH